MSYLQSAQKLPTLKEYRASTFYDGIDQFVQENPHPFLLIELGGMPLDDTGDFLTHKLTVPMDQKLNFRQNKLIQFVAPVKKTTEDLSGGSIISVGRKGGNDIVIREVHISKTHCFFNQTPEGDFILKDANSTNGTWVSGEKLKPMQPRKLEFLDELHIGKQVMAQFLHPEAFYRVAWPD